MKDPLVSVIIPHYNNARYLENAITSVEGQGYARIEIIVVDDGSRSEEKGAAEAICDRHSCRFVSYAENHGPSFARNAGIDLCQGDWIQLLDADDYLAPASIRSRAALAAKGPLWVSGITLRVPAAYSYGDLKKTFLKPAFLASREIFVMNLVKLIGFYFPFTLKKAIRSYDNHGTLYSKELFARYGLFDEELRRGEDTEIRERFESLSQTKPLRSRSIAYFYRVHPAQTVRRAKDDEQNIIHARNLKRRVEEGVSMTNTRLIGGK